jgi:DNA repair exonuclease SbcCD ATPase subunit
MQCAPRANIINEVAQERRRQLKPKSKRPDADVPSVTLRLRCGGKTYDIRRCFDCQGDKANRKAMDEEVREVGALAPVVGGGTAVTAWIAQNVGTEASLLAGCFLTQTDSSNFFHMDVKNKRELLVRALRLQPFSMYVAALEEAIKAHQGVVKAATQLAGGI